MNALVILSLSIVAFLLLSIGWILLMPVRLVVDSEQKLYAISQQGIFSVQVVPSLAPQVVVRVMGIRINAGNKRPSPKAHEADSRPRQRKSIESVVKLMKGLIRSIRVVQFEVEIDTDDYALNARLTPLFFFISKAPLSLGINYEGRSYCRIVIECRLIRVLKPALFFLTTK